jgi:hypothetical protein
MVHLGIERLETCAKAQDVVFYLRYRTLVGEGYEVGVAPVYHDLESLCQHDEDRLGNFNQAYRADDLLDFGDIQLCNPHLQKKLRNIFNKIFCLFIIELFIIGGE